jgi:hypothetical protein
MTDKQPCKRCTAYRPVSLIDQNGICIYCLMMDEAGIGDD